jgi:radical SAM superfamily enzyme YgiQ (UPF0313 family)
MAGTQPVITLINPPSPYSRWGTSLLSIPPIGLAYVAAALEQAGYDVDIVDGVGEWIDESHPMSIAGEDFRIQGGSIPQILDRVRGDSIAVGITCMFMHHWPVVKRIIIALRDRYPNIPIILGGENSSGMPVDSLKEADADAVVVGEGEETIVPLIDALRRGVSLADIDGIAYRSPDGEVRVTSRRARIRRVDEIPPPAWHLMPIRDYMNKKMFHGPSLGATMPILATRGCPYQCTFCTAPAMWTTAWYPRTPEYVVAEMQHYRDLYGATDFHFVDVTTIVKSSWILKFCDALESKGWTDVTWQLPSGTRSEAITYEVAKRLLATGCPMIVYAPESGAPSVLKRIKKRLKLQRMKDSIKAARRAGLKVECFMIIGFPDESLVEILQTYWFMLQLAWLGVEDTGYSGYRPVPGTEISDDLRASGALIYNDGVYLSLMKSTSMFGSVSWNPRFSDRGLGLLRAAGLAIFYSAAFILRPWRLVRLVRNVIARRQTTKLDRVFIQLFDRKGDAVPPPDATPPLRS